MEAIGKAFGLSTVGLVFEDTVDVCNEALEGDDDNN